jgi:hypothetical protein
MDGLGGALALTEGRQCTTCGQQNRDLARFCRKCGSALDVPAEQESADRDLEPGPESDFRNIGATQSAYGLTPDPERRRPLRFPVVVPLAIIFLAGTLAVVGWQAHWPPALFGVKRAAAVQHLPSRPASTPTPEPAGSGISGSPLAPSSAGSASASSPPASPTASPRGGPAIVVHRYFAAINQGNYAKAWRLGGSNSGSSYAAYVAGFQGTVNDVVTIISVSGSVVTADLAALQSDGTTKNFEGTYTVINGVIAKSSVHQVP